MIETKIRTSYQVVEGNIVLFLVNSWLTRSPMLRLIQLRAEEYVHLQNATAKDGNVQKAGQMIILPSSFKRVHRAICTIGRK